MAWMEFSRRTRGTGGICHAVRGSRDPGGNGPYDRKPKLCGIKEFHKEQDGKRFIVFLYVASRFSGELRSSAEGDVFWYPLSELKRSKELADGFSEMLPVFTSDEISEVFYTNDWDTVFC